MSRICVKNIGAKTNEAQLKDIFSSKGEVTDVKVMKKPDGSSRKFAFVGFRTEFQATEAQRYFNNTFIGLSKITVEIAKKLKDEKLQELKQKHSHKTTEKLKEMTEKTKGLNAIDTIKTSKLTESVDNKTENKPVGKYKQEFIDLNNSKKTLAENTLTDDAAVLRNIAKTQRQERNHIDSDSSDHDGDSDSEGYHSLRENNEDDDESDEDEEKSEPAAAAMSDLDYLKSKMKKTLTEDDEEEDNDDSSDEDSDDNSAADEKTKEADGDIEDMDESKNVEGEEDTEDETRLFVKNLPYSCSEEELQALFETYGKVTEVHVPLNPEKKSRGYGFVTFLFPEHAKKAFADLDGSSFQGRVLYIVIAKKPQAKEYSQEEIERYMKKHKLSSFQMKKEEERKKQMNKSDGWNAAFVRSDAVMESVAERYGINQGDLLDTANLQGGDIAVRLAVAETQVIQENADYFKEHGVDINALESVHSKQHASKRSNTTLLVKNLPPDSVIEELESMFARYGAYGSFLVPPSKTIALVDYYEPSEARAAFKGLAYRRYHNSPLYLEWAPLGLIVSSDKPKKETTVKDTIAKAPIQPAPIQPTPIEEPKLAEAILPKTPIEDDDNHQEYSTLFMKNLNFITTEETLLHHLQYSLGIDGIRKALIQKKQIGNALLSQGYGFIEFKSHTAAMVAISRINGSVLDSHALEVKPSDKRITVASTNMTNTVLQQQQAGASSSGAGASTGGVKPTNKLIVRNVAFQATAQELRSLFATFGSIKRVRIPKKMGGKHRGFAFIDFSTPQEAANAMASLKNTHFYGRHLVLEWANDDTEEEELLGGTLAGRQISGDKKIQSLQKRARHDQMNLVQGNKRVRKGAAGDEYDVDGDMGDLV